MQWREFSEAMAEGLLIAVIALAVSFIAGAA